MLRIRPTYLALGFVLVARMLCAGQGINNDRQTNAQILVRVTFENERPAGDQIHVELLTDAGVPVANAFTDQEGRASFRVTFPGAFRLEASGTAIQGTTSTTFRVEDMDKSRTVFVKVKPKVDTSAATSKPNTPAVTSATELRIPSDAQKAFHKGLEAWEHHDLPKAAEYFEKAIAIYPAYDTAYNNLGVMYYQSNQVEKARSAFEKSVALNEKNADADRNLARILINDGNFVRAQELLKKSLLVEPLNPVTLTLLCVAQAQSGDIDGALATARKTHQLPHEGYPLVHYIAGRALEQEGKPQQAYTEYETYLSESPNGAEAQQVRSALAHLTAASTHNSSQ
jgi:tetratricopeptide (TPR) repeat protein